MSPLEVRECVCRNNSEPAPDRPVLHRREDVTLRRPQGLGVAAERDIVVSRFGAVVVS